MPSTLDEQINQLKSTIAEMEAQRDVLGDQFVDSTLGTLQDKLSELELKKEQPAVECRTPPERQMIDLGDAYRGRGAYGDLEFVRSTYQQSLEMFTDMGAPGYIQVLEKRLADFYSL